MHVSIVLMCTKIKRAAGLHCQVCIMSIKGREKYQALGERSKNMASEKHSRKSEC